VKKTSNSAAFATRNELYADPPDPSRENGLNTQGFSTPITAAPSLRELQAAREIAHAFLTATRPSEVYHLALAKVAPLVNAAFACVFLRDQKDQELLRVVAAYNWPQAFAQYLSSMRVRVGNGPTGQAVGENRVVEVFDIFADDALGDWWEAARELGFASSISLPLCTVNSAPEGALTFYFREPEEVRDSDRSLLRLVADQLAATAEKAHLIQNLQHANTRLREQNVELEARFRQAQEARQLKNEFLANVSHELRTPLTAILGYSYLLREGLSGSLAEEQGAAVDKIEGAATTLMGLINDLLDLTHLRLGRTKVEPEICDGVALARAALAAIPPPQTPILVEYDLPDEAVQLETDPTLALRILQNLISNAFKFTAQGSVLVRVRQVDAVASLALPAASRELLPDGPLVVWDIEDTGIGITPADLELIFDEFRQVDGSVTRRYGGTGMGLALSRGLARRLGGEITACSAPGVGSTFTLILPRSAAAPPDEPTTDIAT
jgi:signal transduction histidine kinase